MRINVWRVALVVTGMLVPQAARAQAAHTEKPLERVFVMQAGSGKELHGSLLNIGPETLSMIVDHRRIDLPVNDVLRIDRPGDSLKNGAAIGAALFGVLCAVTCFHGTHDGGQYLSVVTLNSLFGAAIGAGIDAMISGRTTIYRKDGPSASPSRGLALRLRF